MAALQNCTPNGELGRRGFPAAPTPHFVALARAQAQVDVHLQVCTLNVLACRWLFISNNRAGRLEGYGCCCHQ